MKFNTKHLGIIGGILYVSNTILNNNQVKLNLNTKLKLIDNLDEDFIRIEGGDYFNGLDQCDEIYGLDDTRIKNIGDLKKSIKDYRKEKKYNLPLTIKKPGDKFYRNIPININPVEKHVYNKSLNFKEGFSDIVKAVSPSIVSIFTYSYDHYFPLFSFDKEDPNNDFFYYFFNNLLDPERFREQTPTTVGSGFIIDKSGHIVTNNHIIEGAYKIIVILQDDRKVIAEIIGTDRMSDLAVLKINLSNTNYLQWGNSDKSELGDRVLAFGNPFSYGLIIRPGIISGKQRNLEYLGADTYNNFIQTNFTITSGNSGGPLINMNGEVIGVNTDIVSPIVGGIGFAIPSNIAKRNIEILKKGNSIERGWIGVKIKELTLELAESLGVSSNEGVLVVSVKRNGPSYKAGIKKGDIILKFNETPIKNIRDLPRIVRDTEVGTQVNVIIMREGKEQTLLITVKKLPSKPIIIFNYSFGLKIYKINRLKISVRLLTNTDIINRDLPLRTTGLVIKNIEYYSPLSRLEIGNIITEVNRKKITSIKQFENIIRRSQRNSRYIFLNFYDNNSRRMYIYIQL